MGIGPYSRWTPAVALIVLVLAPGLVYNCIRALRSGEGMYDSASTQYMISMNWAGIALGLLALGWAVYTLVRVAMLLF